MKEIRNSNQLIDRKNWLGAAFLDLVNEIVLRFKFRRIEVYGRENIPTADPFILVSNHSSRFDGLMVLRALRRKANYMVSPAELVGYQGVTLPWVGAFPANPKADLIGFAQSGFRKGDGLVVFPEGTVYYDGILHPFKLGAARIAMAAERDGIPVKVIPASIMYEWEAPAVARIIFGESVDLTAYSAHYEKEPLVALRNLSNSLYREVAELRSEISGRPSVAYTDNGKLCRSWAQEFEQAVEQMQEEVQEQKLDQEFDRVA
ncbi:MAG: 1-acyl-sn-glycerol-3-phosphate acyltransferase [Candidatus Melainabacteria bacterium]|nr:1-acyl-sn-glycerol-3-phosphate acyltransferase [Candidatus Melainabacteria bacterium]